MVNYSQISRLVRRATQLARVGTKGTPVELWTLIIVGLGIDRWCRNGLVEEVERSEFWEAVVAAGSELALAPQTVNRDESAVAAKARVAAARSDGARQPGQGVDEVAERRVRAQLARAGVAPQLIEAHIRRQRAAAARAGRGDDGAAGHLRGSVPAGEGDSGGSGKGR